MTFGTGSYAFSVHENWWTLPDGWTFGWVPAVACDSQDRVFVYSRSEHPLIIFDRDGNFLDSWGEDVLKDAHGIYIDAEDNVYCTERDTHCIFKFNRQGELNAVRLPLYRRLDVSVQKRWPFDSWSLKFYFQIINLTNHKNVFNYFWDMEGDPEERRAGKRREIRMLPILPSLGLDFNF